MSRMPKMMKRNNENKRLRTSKYIKNQFKKGQVSGKIFFKAFLIIEE